MLCIQRELIIINLIMQMFQYFCKVRRGQSNALLKIDYENFQYVRSLLHGNSLPGLFL